MSYYKSGKYGYLTLTASNESGNRNIPIYDFSFNLSYPNNSWYDAESQGFPERTFTLPTEHTFSFNTPFLDFGTEKFFQKHHNFSAYLFPINDIYGGIGQSVLFFARITNLTGMWSWRDNIPLRYTLALNITNKVVLATDQDFSQEDVVNVVGSCQRRVEERLNNNEANEFELVNHLEAATFTISANYNKFGHANDVYWIEDQLYPIIDCTVTLKFNTLLHAGDDYNKLFRYNRYFFHAMDLSRRTSMLFSYRFYINDTEYWEFNNMLISRVYDIVVDRVSGAIIGCTVDLAITSKGYSGRAGSGSASVSTHPNDVDTSIFAPNNVPVWPIDIPQLV